MEKAVSLSQIGLYNPQRQSAELTEKLFVVRQKQFDSLMESLNDEKPDSIPQHHLILAQRGMGKTTMLKRIEVELHKEQYRDKFIPVLFTEEQYGLNNLAKFWENSLNALANSLEAEDKNNPVIVEIDNRLKQITKEKPTDNLSEKLYQYLLTFCKKLNRRPVLLVDNIGIVFSRLSKQEQHILRAYISEKSCPVIISAGVAMAGDSDAKEYVVNYKAPFYDFFQIHYLRKLNFEEFEELLQNLAKITQTNITITSKESPRLKSLLQLTGGNPRTSVILFKLLVKGFTADIVDDLEALTDEMTPLYKARFEALSTQQQQILYAISLNWDFINLKKIHEDTGLDNNQLSPQLKRLIDDGWLETTKAYKAKGNAYSISERFFSIWNLMRNGNRKQKEQINCLSRFFEGFFGEEELERTLDTLLDKDICSSNQMRLHLAIMSTKIKKSLRDKISEKVFNTFMENERLGKEFDFPYENFAPAANEDKNSGEFNFSFNNKKEENTFKQGVKLYDVEKYEKSIKKFNEGIALNKQQEAFWTYKGKALLDLGHYEEALTCFDEAIKLKPEIEPLWWLKGNTLIELEHYEEAIICFEKCIEFNPNITAFWVRKGESLYKLERYTDAIDCLDSAIKLEPKDEYLWMKKGEILCDSGNNNDALICFDKVLKIDSKFLSAYFFKALILNDLERYEDAVICFNKAIKLNSTEETLWFEKGKTLGYLQRFKDAIKCFDEVLKLNPDFEPAWFFKGKALKDLERNEDAIICFEESIRLNPENEYAWYEKGDSYEKLQQNELAVADISKAIEINSNNAQSYYERGCLYENLQNHELAIADFTKVIELNINDQWNYLAYSWRGLVYFEQNKFELAIDDYNKAIDITSIEDSLKAMNYRSRGCAKYELSDYSGAIEDFDKSIELDPNDKNVWFEKAECLFELKRYTEAINAYDKATELDSNFQVAWNNKGYTYMEMKDYDKAVFAYEKSRAINPQNLKPKFYLMFLYRDKLKEKNKAIEIFESIKEEEINQNEEKEFACRYYLHKTLFELYEQNKGMAKENLLRAFEVLEDEQKLSFIVNEEWWSRISSVVIDLDYGSWLLEIMEEKGYDVILSPYYTAIRALVIERTENAETAEIYLRNQAVEKSEPARVIIKKMRKYM
ncbi:hypothetical protein FACS1894178_5000 [Bacteroidia bacterium]|nr:hypothetical protein FACS1894178_5000 [Bacteroidia bacterium]